MDRQQIAKSGKSCCNKEWQTPGINSSCNGFVLIFILWALTILALVALGFSKDTRMAIALKSVTTERLKDQYAARGASLYAFAKMSIDENVSNNKVNSNSNTPGADHGGVSATIKPGDFPKGVELPKGGDAPTGTEDGQVERDSGETRINHTEKWKPGKNPHFVTIGDRDCKVFLSSENGKININGLNDKNREIFVNFLIKMDVDTSDADIIADSILDWTDPNDLTHINGAEDGYYESLPDPYKAKDSPFNSLEELTLVRGVTPEIFEHIKDYITVYGNKEISINVNLASKEVLSSLPGLSEEIVDELALYIEENGPIDNREDLREVFWDLGVIGEGFEAVKRYLTLQNSDFVTISAYSGGLSQMPKQSDDSGSQNAYDFKLIVGKADSGYKIYAAYPE